MENKKTDLQIKVIGKIKVLRQQANISQKDLADYLDVTLGQIGNIESLKYKNKYTLKHLLLLSQKFHVPIAELLFDESMNDPDIELVLGKIVEYLD